MSLEITKEILNRLYNKYESELRLAKADLRPNYDKDDHLYDGIEEDDRDTIYSSISNLYASVGDTAGPIVFDVTNVFITEGRALFELKQLRTLIKTDLETLNSLKQKYQKKNRNPYVITTCLDYHQVIYDIIEEILSSDEVQKFENPELMSQLKTDNDNLRFRLYWTKRRWKYISHLIAFFPFLIGVGVLVCLKESKVLNNFIRIGILISSSLFTIAFNLLFNNYSTFKDSWKLFTKGGRKKLLDKEKTDFLKSNASR